MAFDRGFRRDGEGDDSSMEVRSGVGVLLLRRIAIGTDRASGPGECGRGELAS